MDTQSSSPVCSSCRVLKRTSFNNCSVKELADYFPGKKFLYFVENDFLFREHQAAEGVFCIYSGRVKVSKKGKDQKEHIMRLAKPGYLLGLSLFTGKFYTNSAVALEKTAACFIHKDEFLPFIHSNPKVLIKIMKYLCYEIETVEKKYL